MVEARQRIEEEQRQKEELLATPQVIHVKEDIHDEAADDENEAGGMLLCVGRYLVLKNIK